MLRYYEEQDLLHPQRAANGYRRYSEAAVYRVQQIRVLLDSGLTTEIIRRILPFLDKPEQIHLHPDCVTPEVAGLLRREAERIQQRIDCLTRNRDALHAYLAAVQPGTAPPHDAGPEQRKHAWAEPTPRLYDRPDEEGAHKQPTQGAP